MKTNNRLLESAIGRFPPLFGLRGYREDVFRVNPHTSFITTAGTAILHTDVWSGGLWRSFGKGTASELLAQVTPIPALEGARVIHALNPGSWVLTDDAMSAILDTQPWTQTPPQNGRRWLRTHDLLYHLGVAGNGQ